MTDTYKVLGQVKTTADENAAAYIVPLSTQASLSSISIVNSGATSSYTLSAVKSSEYQSLLSPITEWTQVGTTFTGVNSYDRLGLDVAISNNGNRVAIMNQGLSGAQPGSVAIYEWSGTQWVKLGGTIYEILSGGYQDGCIAISSDGSLVAVGGPFEGYGSYNSGTVRVYEFNGTSWQERGYVQGDNDEDRFGISVGLSGDGGRLAVGATLHDYSTFTNSGKVSVYEYDTQTLSYQTMVNIYGASNSDQLGSSVAISRNGSTVAYVNPLSDLSWISPGLTNYGYVEVVRYENSSWQSIGDRILGVGAGSMVDAVVSLSETGNRLCIGRPNDTVSTDGKVSIYDFNGTSWVPVGNEITDFDTNVSGEKTGINVSLSNDGNTVAISARYATGNYSIVKVYELVGNTWTQKDSTITGNEAYDDAYVVALSGDGSSFILGASGADAVATSAGYAKVYENIQIGESISSPPLKSNLITTKAIESGAHHEIAGGVQLSQGDALVVNSPSSNLIVNVFGVEIS